MTKRTQVKKPALAEAPKPVATAVATEAPAPSTPKASADDKRLVVDGINAVLNGVDLTAPIGVEDAVELYARIRAHVPTWASVDVYHRHRDLVVTARMGSEVLHRRIMEAK